MGGCQNYGPFLGTLNIRCRIIIWIQKGTIILTTTYIYIYRYVRVILGLYEVYIGIVGVILGLYYGCIGITEANMETAIIGYILGLYRHNGKWKHVCMYMCIYI